MPELFTGINRQGGIGASEVAAILGVDPYSQAFDVWESKTCDAEEFAARFDFSVREDDESPAEIGKAIEPIVASLYESRTGIEVNVSPTVQSREYPWLFASPDRIAADKSRGLEIKVISARMASWWGAEGTSEICEYYVPQVQACMLVTGIRRWDVAAFIGGIDLRVYHLEADDELQNLIVEYTQKFWEENVLTHTPPAIDYEHKSAPDAIKRKYGHLVTETCELNPIIQSYADVYTDLGKQITDLQKARQTVLNQIADAMGTKTLGALPDGREIHRKEITRKGYTVEDTKYISTSIKRPKK